MYYYKRFIIVLCTVVSAIFFQQGESGAAEVMSIEEKIHFTLVANPGSSKYNIADEIQSDETDLIRPYLMDRNWETRYEAMNLLARLPSESTSAILMGLQSHDDALRFAAMSNVRRALKSADVRRMWARVAPLPRSDSGDANYGLLRDVLGVLSEDEVDEIREELVTGILQNMDDYNASGVHAMILVMGGIVEQGDNRVLSRLVEVEENIDAYNAPELRTATPGIVDTDDILDAVLYAKVNLGDGKAFVQYRDDVLNGDVEIKERRVKYLSRMGQTVAMLGLVSECLEDVTEIRQCTESECSSCSEEHMRVCDVAVETLQKWFDDFPYRTNRCHIHSHAEIDVARKYALRQYDAMKE